MLTFSPVGLAVLLAVLAPTVLLSVAPPTTPWPAGRDRLAVAVAEHGGRVAVCLLLVLVPPAPDHAVLATRGWHDLPLGLATALLVANLVPWRRYLRGGRRLADLFRPWGPVPVPAAVLPVLALLAVATGTGDGLLAVAAVVFGAGHLTASARVAGAVLAGAHPPGRPERPDGPARDDGPA